MEQYNQFDVVYLKDVIEFLDSLPEQARNKIVYNVRKIQGGFSSNELFKKLEGNSDLWEFRTLYDGIQYRLLAFWDATEKRLVIATHGFIKKTWKVPTKEIDKAKTLRQQYYESK